MKWQHTLIAVFFLVVLAIVAAVLARRGRNLQRQLQASVEQGALLQDKLHAETNARANAERDLASLQQALSGQEAALQEFVQRVHIVHSVTLDLAVEGSSEDGGAMLSERVPVIAVDLVAPDGRVVRFANDFEAPPTVQALDTGATRLTFRCEPVRAPDVHGRPIAELETFRTLRAAYGGVLAGVGVAVTPEATKQVVVRVNDVEVVNAAVTPSAPDSWDYSLEGAFPGLYDRYQADLHTRIRAASATSTATP